MVMTNSDLTISYFSVGEANTNNNHIGLEIEAYYITIGTSIL
jgi:hypothetical protein